MSKHGKQPKAPDDLPYWRRAHRDWRFVVGMMLMIAAITVYVMSDNLTLQPRSQTQGPLSGAP